MTELILDVVIVVPGIMGSTLARREGDDLVPIWAPSAGGLIHALRTLGGSVKSLELKEDVADGDPGDGIVATGLMPGIHVIPGVWSPTRGYTPLVTWLTTTFHLIRYDATAAFADDDAPLPNLVCFPYDWRLSNRRSAHALKDTIEPILFRWRAQDQAFADARFVFICHSMGGLVARWYAEQLGGAELTRKIITIGTPHRGSVKSLESLVNGLGVQLGPIAFSLTRMIRSFPSMYELLPAYRCVERADRLCAPHETTLPELSTERVSRARVDFHDRLSAAPTRDATGYDLHLIVGTRQPTWATAALESGRVVPSLRIEGDDLGGDGTVSRLAATPPGVPLDSNVIVGLSEQHGSLQHHAAVLEQVYTALTGTNRVYMDIDADGPEVGLDVRPVHQPDEPLQVRATCSSDDVRLRATVEDEAGQLVASELLWREQHGTFAAEFAPCDPGGYAIRVTRDGPTANPVQPVTGFTLVWDPSINSAHGLA